MQNPRLASRYAKSLLDLAIEQNQLEEVLKDINYLDEVGKQSKDFVNVLRSPIINSDKKHVIIDAVIGKRIGKLTTAFITLLTNKGRESNLPEIAQSFIKQYKELKNIRSVKLITATPLTDKVREEIKSRIVASLKNDKIELTEEVNPDLIGGFILETEDKLFDATIRRDLKDIKAQFMKNIYVSELR